MNNLDDGVASGPPDRRTDRKQKKKRGKCSREKIVESGKSLTGVGAGGWVGRRLCMGGCCRVTRVLTRCH